MKILVAGIGNIFYRDDAFGCEVVRRLQYRDLPPEVTVTDFGIRSYDLTYGLTDDFDVIILVDAIPRGQPPGMVYLIEPDLSDVDKLEHAMAGAHTMNPMAAIRMAQANGGISARLFLVGCEPETLEDEDGEMGLSKKVQDAIPEAMTMVESLVGNLLQTGKPEHEIAGRFAA